LINKEPTMSQLSEQFSAVRQAQINAQLKIFSHFSARAVENAEKFLALNLHTSRAALDQSAAAFKQMIAAEDPRDLLALVTQGQQHFDSLLAYGRALAGIAAGEPLAVTAAAQTLPTEAPEVKAEPPALVVEAAPQGDAETASATATPTPSVAETARKPAPRVKPLAKAASKVAGKAVLAKPVAAPFPAVEGAQRELLPPRTAKKK
jgi:phasin family protein